MKTRNELFEEVKNLIAEKIGVDEGTISMNSSLRDDIGADSLELVDLAMDFEENYKIKIDNSEFQTIETVDEILNLLMEKIQKVA